MAETAKRPPNRHRSAEDSGGVHIFAVDLFRKNGCVIDFSILPDMQPRYFTTPAAVPENAPLAALMAPAAPPWKLRPVVAALG